MSAIVTQELRELTLAREARYLGDAAENPAPEARHSTVHVRVTSLGSLNEAAGSMKSGRIESTLQLEEVAAAWRASSR